MPLLIRGLDLEDLACRADIVNTLTNAIDAPSDEKSLLPEYASTLVTSVLKNTIVTYMPDPVSSGNECRAMLTRKYRKFGSLR